MTVSPADISALRDGHPHISKIYMSVLKPTVVYCGTVSGSPVFGTRDVTVVDVSGDITDIEAGMTVFVGTSCGDNSISKRRFRSRVGQVLTLDENSITWVAGQYITVYKNWELWSIFQYIDPTTYVFYKDYDIAYTNDNLYQSPVAIAGSNRAKFIDGPYVSFSLDASDSYAVASGATISSYLWECDGGSIVNSAAAVTTINFTAPGQYWLKLTVTDSNGKTQSTRRVLFVHQRTGVYAPHTGFEIDAALSGDWSRGGWTTSVKLRADASITDIPNGALVVLWNETYFGGAEYYVGGDNTLFVGYIADEKITKELDVSYVTLNLETINFLLDKTAMRSVSIENDSTPSTWYEMANLTMRRAVHHLLRWHSTMLDICDVFMDEDDNLIYALDDFTNGTLYKMIDVFTYQHGNFSHLCSSRVGKVYLDRDINVLTVAESAAKGVDFIMDNADRRGPTDLDIVRDPHNRVSYVLVSGTSYDGSTNTPIIAQAPGEIPDNFGSTETTFERLVLENQAQANFYAGKVIAIANREFVEIRIPLAGNYLGVLDIVPQRWWYLQFDANSNKREVSFAGNVVPRLINTEISTQAGTILVEVGVEPEVSSVDGIAAPIPTTEPPDNPADYPMPPIPELPPWPPLPLPTTCHEQPTAPANGPFTGAFVGTLSSIDPVPYVLNYLNSYIRMGSSTFKTTVLIEGCKYQSTNGGASWTPWLDTDGLVISAYDIATGPKSPVATNFPVLASDTDGCGWRGGEFTQAAAVATDCYMTKLEPAQLFFNGLDEFEMIAGCSHTEIIDAMRWKSLGVTPPEDASQKTYVVARLHFSSLAAFINEASGSLKFSFIPVSGGSPVAGFGGDYGAAVYGARIADHHGDPLDVYSIPAPDGISHDGSTDPAVRIGDVGYFYQVRTGAQHDIILGDNYMGFMTQGYNGAIGAFETEFQMMNIYWSKSGNPDQLLMTSVIHRIDVTAIRVYNVCFD